MELSLREWLIIGGVVIIALIIIDGWRRMRSNRNTLRMQIDKSLTDLPEETHNPELPNGGFRVLNADPDLPSNNQPDAAVDLAGVSSEPLSDEQVDELRQVKPADHQAADEQPNAFADSAFADGTDSLSAPRTVDNSIPEEPDFTETVSAARVVGSEPVEQESEVAAESFRPAERTEEIAFDELSAVRSVAEVEASETETFSVREETIDLDELQPQVSPSAYQEDDFNGELGEVRVVSHTSPSDEFTEVADNDQQPYVADLAEERQEPVFSVEALTEEVIADNHFSQDSAIQQEPENDAFAADTHFAEASQSEPVTQPEPELHAEELPAAAVVDYQEEPLFVAQETADADLSAERDPLFEPLTNIDDGLDDYAGTDFAAELPEAHPVPQEQAEVEQPATYVQPEAEPEAAEPVQQSPSFNYDDDDLSQGAEEFISPRLTEQVVDDPQDHEFDFEKPITELMSPSGYAGGPQQTTMDLGDDFTMPAEPARVAAEQPVAPQVVQADIAHTPEVPEYTQSSRADDSEEDDLLSAPLITDKLVTSRVEEPVQPTVNVTDDLPAFSAVEPEPDFNEPVFAEPSLDDVPAFGAAAQAPQPEESKPQQPAAGRSLQKVPEADKVLVISVVTRSEEVFNGRNLLQIVLACGMRFGEMQIFNRYEDGFDQGAIQFSMTNAMEPGVFDIDRMDELQTRGVTFFMSMEEPRDVMNAYECMLGTAEAVAKNLGGELLDENRSSMRTQTKEHYRERIRHFEMRKLKPQL